MRDFGSIFDLKLLAVLRCRYDVFTEFVLAADSISSVAQMSSGLCRGNFVDCQRRAILQRDYQAKGQKEDDIDDNQSKGDLDNRSSKNNQDYDRFCPSATAGSAPGAIINVWIGAKVDPAKLPIGDDSVTTSGAGVGKLFACRAGNPNAPGASADGPWINADGNTWDSTTKLAVKGEVSWPTAKYTETGIGG
jgi:hypothetical protein